MDEFVVLTKFQYDKICPPRVASAETIHKKNDSVLAPNDVISKPPPVSKTAEKEKSILSNPEKTSNAYKMLSHEGRMLYDFLEQSDPAIDWNSDNEVLLMGTVIPNSNIYKLINDVTNKNGAISSEKDIFRLFKNWLITNKAPAHLLNSTVYDKKDSSPKITPTLNPQNFPSVNELKQNQEKSGSEFVDIESQSTSNDASATAIAELEKNVTEKSNDLNIEKLRKSDRIRKPPAKYGHGKKASRKRIKWLKY